jgi:hypothetical protein
MSGSSATETVVAFQQYVDPHQLQAVTEVSGTCSAA